MNYAQPINIDAAIAQLNTLKAASLPRTETLDVPLATKAPAAQTSVAVSVSTEQIAAPAAVQSAVPSVNRVQQQRYQLCQQALDYLQLVQRVSGELCAQLNKHPEASARDIVSLGDLAKAIDAQHQTRKQNAPENVAPQPLRAQPTAASAQYVRSMQEQASLLMADAPLEPQGTESARLSDADIARLSAAPHEEQRAAALAINQAVDAAAMSEDYTSPLSANFGAEPASAIIESVAQSSLSLQQHTANAQLELHSAVPQLSAIDEPEMPDYLRDIPDDDIPPEDGEPEAAEQSLVVGTLSDEGDELKELPHEEQTAQAMLFSPDRQQGVQSVAPQLNTRPSDLAPRRALQPIKHLPTGYCAPQFKGLSPITVEDFYPQLATHSPWYDLIEKAAIPPGPERTALLYSALVSGPNADGSIELTMSEEYRTFILGGKALPLLNNLFSQYFTRTIELKIHFTTGTPTDAPASVAQQLMGAAVEYQRAELMRVPFINALFSGLEENMQEVMLTLYQEDK